MTSAKPQAEGSLDSIHYDFAAALGASLSAHLRTTVTVSFSFAERLCYDDFLHSLGEVSCLAVLKIDPPGAQALLDLSLPVIYPMIDRLLGGGGQTADLGAAVPHRPLTQIEQGLALQIVERAAGLLADNWNSGARGDLVVREESLESGPADVRIMPGEEIVWAARFDVRFVGSGGDTSAGSGGGGTMSLCVPAPVAAQLLQDAPPADPAASSGPLSLAERNAARADLTRNILDAAVELRALLAETKVRLSDVLTMQVGDVITTDKNASEEVPVQVQGKDKFQAKLGHLRGTRAVQITRRFGQADQSQEDRS